MENVLAEWVGYYGMNPVYDTSGITCLCGRNTEVVVYVSHIEDSMCECDDLVDDVSGYEDGVLLFGGVA